MKRVFLFLPLCLLSVLCTFGQGVALGDAYEIDGIPGFVFYLDETGEHGLMMSFPVLTQDAANKMEKQVGKYAKRMGVSEEELKNKYLTPKMILPLPTTHIPSKDFSSVYSDLLPLLGNDGEQNTIAIKEFCEEKNLLMQDYFPLVYWSFQLGDGWFIPGTDELRLFAEFYLGGLGRQNGILTTNFLLKRSKEVSNDASVQMQIMQVASLGLCSSSMKSSSFGFQTLLQISSKIPPKSWFEIDVEGDLLKSRGKDCARGCAVHRF